VTARVALSPLAYVYDGREAVGHVLARGRAGFEGASRLAQQIDSATDRDGGDALRRAHHADRRAKSPHIRG
jgi:hypothetical protein